MISSIWLSIGRTSSKLIVQATRSTEYGEDGDDDVPLLAHCVAHRGGWYVLSGPHMWCMLAFLPSALAHCGCQWSTRLRAVGSAGSRHRAGSRILHLPDDMCGCCGCPDALACRCSFTQVNISDDSHMKLDPTGSIPDEIHARALGSSFFSVRRPTCCTKLLARKKNTTNY